MDPFLIIWDRFGHRYLFARGGTWEWDLAEEPEYKHFKLISSFWARQVLENIRDNDLLLRVYGIYAGYREASPNLDPYDVREELIRHLVDVDMDGNKVLGLGPELCVFKEEHPWPVVPRTYPKLDNVREPARLDATNSWVTVECVDDSDEHEPVYGVQLEIITRAGLVYTRYTDAKGVVFLNGIAPGGVTIRVLGMDESMWWPLEGEQSEATPSDDRPRWHEVRRGDSLSKIARQYGARSWKALWNYPKNQPLREKRQSPHVLHVGDFVAVPPTMIGAIRRDTEATHRIVMKRGRAVVALLNAHLLDDPGGLSAHWDTGTSSLMAASDVHRDDTSMVLRLSHMPAQTAVALVGSSGAQGEGGSELA